eukprot:7743-Heterococcus_DN1.PRE.1
MGLSWSCPPIKDKKEPQPFLHAACRRHAVAWVSNSLVNGRAPEAAAGGALSLFDICFKCFAFYVLYAKRSATSRSARNTSKLSACKTASPLRMAWNSSRPVRQLHLLNKLDIMRWASYAEVTFRAKNSYFIERRPIDYVPTATLWSCCGRVP